MINWNLLDTVLCLYLWKSKNINKMKIEQLEKEVKYSTACSSGSGGQHVNRVETKVTLMFNIAVSRGLTSNEKELLRAKYPKKINSAGIFQISSQKERSQLRNRLRVTKKFFALLEKAFKKKKVRKATKVPKGVNEKRLNDKRIKSKKKADRRLY